MDGNEITVGGVAVGPTEIITIGTMLAALLTLVFHNDWGLAAHIQTIAAQALIVLPVALGILRSFKHHLNVKVAVAQIAATAKAAPTSYVTTTTNTAGGAVTSTFPVATVPAVTPDPNLGTDAASSAVDVDSIPEDLPQ